jgi:asparagine synthase (glutamine-hydrolysing)
VGVCLSGGLDSSCIVSVLIKEFNKRDINTFSAVYEKGDEADESVFIDEFKRELKNMYFINPSAQSLMADLKSFIDCHSEPVATLGSYAQFRVMQLAKDHVTVTLDGQGADEQLAGYHYFFASYFKGLLKSAGFLNLIKEMAAYIRIHRSLTAIKYLGLYMAPLFLKDRLSKISHDYIDEDFYWQGKMSSHLKTGLYNPGNLNESLIQHFEFKLEHLLKWEDHNSMWHSLESRVPFLDHHLVERTLSLSPGKIIKQGTTKYILRQAMKGILPEPIRTRRDKVGFATPWDKWFKTSAFKNLILDLLHSAAARERGILNVEKCLKGYEHFIGGKISIPKELWKWVNLELWFQAFIDGEHAK